MGIITIRRVIQIIGLGILSAIIWWFGPGLHLFDSQPLVEESSRVLTISILFAVWLLWEIWRFWRAWRANRHLIERLANKEGLAALSETTAQEEVEILRQCFEKALRALRETHFGSSGRLYDLPWYLVVGSSNSGKTTLLRNSGLNFPLADALGIDLVHGSGGTRHCDWWFTEQAALIDTAGRYVTQDVEKEIDQAGWSGFLGLLREARPHQPINGILLTVGLDALISTDVVDRRNLAATLRARIQDMLLGFRLTLPIYVIVTKMDRIAGFTEFFDTLDQDQQSQVFGTTFPLEQDLADMPEAFAQGFNDSIARIAALTFDRLHGEEKDQSRADIFSFPQQLASIKPVLVEFLTDLFRPSRYTVAPLLRGVYLTSATQEGVPIDRLADSFSQTYGLSFDRPETRPDRRRKAEGRPLFINRLLKDVLFQETTLAGMTPSAFRMLWQRRAMFIAMLALLTAISALWYTAFEDTYDRIEILETRLDRYHALTLGRVSDLSVGTAIDILTAGKSLVDVFDNVSPLTLIANIGLTTENTLAGLSRDAFERMLLNILLPRLVMRLEQRLDQTGLYDPDNEAIDGLRSLLAIYLMMGDPERFDKAAVRRWVTGEAVAMYPLNRDRRDAFLAYFDSLEPLLPKALPLKQSLVAAVRQQLIKVPQVDQVYAALKEEAAFRSQVAPLNLTRAAGYPAQQVLRMGSNSTHIPGLYTRDGFYQLLLRRTPQLAASKFQNDWIIGEAASQKSAEETRRIIRGVAKRYEIDFIEHWEQALDTVALRDLQTLPALVSALEILGAVDSPVVNLLNALKTNTDLEPPSMSLPKRVSGTGIERTVDAVRTASSSLDAASSAYAIRSFSDGSERDWPGTLIQAHFAPHRRLVDPSAGAGQREIGRVTDQLAATFSALSSVSKSADPEKSAYGMLRQMIDGGRNDDITPLSRLALKQPQPLRRILQKLASQSRALLVKLAGSHINALWQRDIVPQCNDLIVNRYPVYKDANIETSLHDFGVFFSPSGTLETFLDEKLAPFLDRRTSMWRWRTVNGVSLGLSGSALRQLQQASQVGKAFFPEGGTLPTVRFGLTPYKMSSNAISAEFMLSRKALKYRHEPPRTRILTWPGSMGDGSLRISLTSMDGVTYFREEKGPWALFRIIDEIGGLAATSVPDRYFMRLRFKDISISYLIEAASVINPFQLERLRHFKCPPRL